MMTFQFQVLPKNVDELRAYPLSTPHAAAALLVATFCRYVESPEDGLAMLEYLNGPADLNNVDRQFIKERFRDKPYLPFSYFRGATPENNYTPAQPYTIDVYDWAYTMDQGYTKVFVQSGGADSQRPVTLRQKGNEHFVWEYSSVVTGIRIPKQADPWA